MSFFYSSLHSSSCKFNGSAVVSSRVLLGTFSVSECEKIYPIINLTFLIKFNFYFLFFSTFFLILLVLSRLALMIEFIFFLLIAEGVFFGVYFSLLIIQYLHFPFLDSWFSIVLRSRFGISRLD